MSKIKALDFANYVDANRQSLIEHCKDNNKQIDDDASLATAVAVNNTINIDYSLDENKPVRRVFNYDGTLISEENVNLGDAVTLPTDPPTLNNSLIEFKKWITSTASQTAIEDFDIVPICRVKEQIDVNGTLVRPTIIKMIVPINSTFSPTITYTKTSNQNLYIDWGDETIDEITSATTNGTQNHTYAVGVGGEMLIKLYSLGAYKLRGTTSSYSTNYPFGSQACNDAVKEIYLGDNVNIGDYGILNCRGLEYILFPDTITTWGSYCYGYNTSLKSMIFPDSITSLPTPSTSITIPSIQYMFIPSTISVCSIPAQLTNVDAVLHEGITSLYYPSIKSKKLKVPSTVTTLIAGTFQSNSYLEEVELPNSITSFGSGNNFYECKALKSINLPTSLSSMPSNCFRACYSLERITIPASMTSLADFDSCYSLREVIISNDYTGNLYFSRCYNLSKETLLRFGNVIKSGKVLKVATAVKNRLDTILVNSLGEEDAEGTMTLLEYITNKGATVSVGD